MLLFSILGSLALIALIVTGALWSFMKVANYCFTKFDAELALYLSMLYLVLIIFMLISLPVIMAYWL